MSDATPNNFRGITAGIIAALPLYIIGAAAMDPIMHLYAAALVLDGIAEGLAVDSDALAELEGQGRGAMMRAAGLTYAALIVAPIDFAHLHITDGYDVWLRFSALAVAVFGMALRVWAMQVNPFFTPFTTIQTEREHRVVDLGPYRLVRHPGDLGAILTIVAGQIALNSGISAAIAAVAAIIVVHQVIDEDRFLTDHLDGFKEYSLRVPYRLVPPFA